MSWLKLLAVAALPLVVFAQDVGQPISQNASQTTDQTSNQSSNQSADQITQQKARQAAAAAFYAPPPASAGSTQHGVIAEPALIVPAGDTLLEKGRYLARAGDCISCHTRPGGAPFAGGLSLKTPFGTIVSTNITPHKTQGIGNYTEEDFVRLMRHGKSEDGQNIYPAMPYANFARLSDGDLQALYAYFMKGVPAAAQTNATTNLPWPFSVRALVSVWNRLYVPTAPYAPEPTQSAEWNRGAYLVQGLGHCGACHTPRSVTGAEKASTEKGGKLFLSGAIIDGWYAQPLRKLSSWSNQDIVDYLQTGRSRHTAAFGAMAEVVGNSTQHMTTPDLTAVAVYLKSLEPTPLDASSASSTSTTSSTFTTAAAITTTTTATTVTATALRTGDTRTAGALIYLNNCSACHQSSGQGVQRTFPSLAQSTTVAAQDATSLIRIVLQGAAMPSTTAAPSALAMPGFDWRLSDANVADVLTFVRNSWGNQAAAVNAQSVAKVRSDLATSKAQK